VSDDLIAAHLQGRHVMGVYPLLEDETCWFLAADFDGAERTVEASRLNEIPDDEERLILATGRYVGEGFDDARLDTLFLAIPVSWKGTIVQYAGRLHRAHRRKKDVRIYDYVDGHVPMLHRMFERRLRGYRALGYVRDKSSEDEDVKDGPVVELDAEALRSLDAAHGS
jgi:superfamily II DNA or RNA helicase